MAQRTGLQTFTKIAHSLCKLLGTWQGSITAAINASSLTSQEKADALSYINAANTACGAFVKLMTKWES